MQGTDGAALVDDLKVKPTDIVVSLGMDPRADTGALGNLLLVAALSFCN
jgi:hypothetical protein